MYLINDKTIDFVWTKSRVSEKVEEATSSFASRGGREQFDTLVFSFDESVIFERLFNEAAVALDEVFSMNVTDKRPDENIVRTAKTDSAKNNDTESETESEENHVVTVERRQRENISENRIDKLDKAGEEFLVCHIAASWFDMSLQAEASILFSSRVEALRGKIVGELLPLSEYPYGRSYTVIEL